MKTLREETMVSVVIPTYNHAHLIGKALKSLIDQTHGRWEALVINNFSKDKTIEVVESFKDSRIKILNFSNNGIIAASRNHGIHHSSCEYIAFLDSDDYWYPTKLEKCLNQILKEKADLCVNSEMVILGDRELKVMKCGTSKELTFHQLLYRQNFISTSSVLTKKECLTKMGGFTEDLTAITAEDYDLWLRMAKEGYKFTAVDEVLGGHLEHASNNSSNVKKHHDATLKVIDDHFQLIPPDRINKKIRYANLFYGSGRNATKQKMYRDALFYFFEALKNNPFKFKIYAAIGVVLLKKLKVMS